MLSDGIEIHRTYEVGDILNTDMGKIVTFDDMISDLAKVPIIYVGEKHSNLNHHQKQMEIIQALVKLDHKLSIGLEMFDYTYQNILNSWVYGDLTEKRFLELSHWYANWRFDFDLYRDILNYVKDEKLKTICLNIPFHIPSKVATGGIGSLSGEDRKHLPERIDLSCNTHKDYIMSIHKSHQILGREEFDFFYEAQCLWEDFMAEKIVKNMVNTKRGKIVILVGNGHIINNFAIPSRVQSKLKKNFRVVCLATTDLKNNLNFLSADYVLFTHPHKSCSRKVDKQ